MKTINDYAELVKEKHALNKTIAPVEADETDASKAYAVGEQLILSGILYDVIVPISQHDVITTTGSGANIAPAGPISAKLSDEVETRAMLGAHNRASFDTPLGKAGYVSYTKTDTGVRITNTTSENYRYQQFAIVLEKNTDYIVSSDITVTSGKGGIVIKGDTSGNLLAKGELNSGRVSYTFNSGEHSTWYFSLYSAYSTAEIGDVLYANFMIRRASDLSTEYAPYAMTNRELTEAFPNKIIVNDFYTYTAENTWEYTGLSFTLEKDALVDIRAGYNNGVPNGVAVGLSSTNTAQFVALSYNADLSASKTVVAFLPAGTYYVWGNYKSANSNQIKATKLIEF